MTLARGALGAVMVTLWACSGPERADRSASSASTVTILDPNYEAIFNPSWSMPARFLVYSPLVVVDEDGTTQPRLAQRWEHSEDRRRWTIYLRSDVHWHDGIPFTARDVAFTIRMMSHPDVAFRGRPDTIVVVDDTTIILERDRPWNALNWWWVYYPEHLLGDVPPAEFFDAEFWTQPVGTGPFRYVRHVPRTVFELEANPNYFRGTPRIDRVRIKFGGGSALAELQSGNVDAVNSVSRADVIRLREDTRFRVHYLMYPDPGIETLYWNHHHPFLGDVRVRRALTLAIDRKELHRFLWLPEAIPVVDVPFSSRQLRERTLPPPLPYDPAWARALLDSAGWLDTDGDGLRARGGRLARISALLHGGGSAGTYAWDQTAVYIQDALAAVGVRMEIATSGSPTILRVRAGEFEAAFAPFSLDELRSSWGPAAPYGYHDPELWEIAQALDTVYDPGVRDSLFRTTWPIVQRDLPVAFLAPRTQHVVAHRRLQGLESPLHAHLYALLEDLWITPEDPGP